MNKQQLEQLKQEYNQITNKLKQLTEEELKLVTGGVINRETEIQPSESSISQTTDNNSLPPEVNAK